MNLDIEILKFLESKTFERSKYKKRTFDDWKRLYKRFGFRYPSFKVRVEKCEYTSGICTSKTLGAREPDDKIINFEIEISDDCYRHDTRI